ncbi:hypothetical protein [Yoonia sp. 2307UL14-13]|uniref:hypothetical protein n=1 Tax=Yoonia sp. 2307UL14-13 TaxID=3126506 RepID=UPI0030B33AA7
MSTDPILRLYLFFATENDSALILRRSGKKMYNLIGWDRSNDGFVEGQWLKKSVRAEDCALSPDGRHFIYAVREANPDTRATSNYTVVSRAPWFTALALFPQEWAWRSGGYFLDNDLYRIHGDTDYDDIVGAADGLFQVVVGEITKDCRTGLRLRNGQPAPLSKALRDQLLDGGPVQRDIAMDRYETQAGRLYRLANGEPELIRDFTDMEPQFIRAPYDTRSKQDVADDWHPLRDDG